MAELFPGNQVLDDQLSTPWLTQPKLSSRASSPINLSSSVNALYSSVPIGTIVPLQPNSGTTGPGAEGHKNTGSNGDISNFGGRLNNPLSEYSSYTYRIGLRMMSSGQYNRYVAGDKSAIREMQIIVQSGGITKSTDPISNTSKRSESFPLDLYIDNLVIKTTTGAQETSIPSNTLEYSFQILEPYGFTFLARLVDAATKMQKQGGPEINGQAPVALRQQYLLTINFYGYDAAGNIVSGDSQNIDPTSSFERSFPIRFKTLTYKLDNKMVVYSATAFLVADAGRSSKRGLTTSDITIRANTVKDALVGSTDTTGNTTILGLCQALNANQQKQLNDGDIEIPDVYKIVFGDPEIENALLTGIEFYYKPSAPVTAVNASEQSNVKTSQSGRANIVDKNVRTIQIPTGQTIIQTIEQIVSMSSYISKKLSATDKEQSQYDLQCGPDYVLEDGKQLAWFNITPIAKTIDNNAWDTKRKDYAYEITYVINRYEIPYMRSLYVKETTPYRGPHKRYNYWYTGKNKEILSYEQNFNMSYYVAAVSASTAPIVGDSTDAPMAVKPSSSYADVSGRAPMTAEILGSVKSFLYSPSDNKDARLKILGDPDYLMTAISGNVSQILKKYYATDLTINPNSGQVFIEIDFNQAEDYDISSGVMPTNHDIYFWKYPDNINVSGMIFQVMNVTSTFNRGTFTQDLKLVLPSFPNKLATKNNTAAAATGRVETVREAFNSGRPGTNPNGEAAPNGSAPKAITAFNSGAVGTNPNGEAAPGGSATKSAVVDDNSVGSGSEGDRLRARFGDFNDTYNGTSRVSRILNSTPTTPTIASARIDRPN
jgi:hypothetical protein